MPSHLLTTTINDLLYNSHTSPKISSPPQNLPQGHHLVYFPIQLPPSRLIPDGADPDHSPGSPYTRRVWAGGEVTFRGEGMKLDARPVICREKIEDVNLKGKEGEEKVYVDIWRRYGTGHKAEGREEWDIEERRTLVFMKEEKESASSPARLLKSLSFNAHSIHFDPQFAREVDGHRSLLVHGPFTLALMLRVLNDQIGSSASVHKFNYRNYAPLYVNEGMSINVRRVSKDEGVEGRWDVWIEGPEGGMAVKGTADVVSK
ncbi:hypothetical protein ACHAPD_003395 [Fusarium lateritium]